MRVKEHLLQLQEEAFKQELSFKEWLYFYMDEPTEKELNDMEKSLYRSIPANSKTPHYQAANSANYNNQPQGA